MKAYDLVLYIVPKVLHSHKKVKLNWLPPGEECRLFPSMN